MIKFEFLPALNGDRIFISLDNEKFIIMAIFSLSVGNLNPAQQIQLKVV